jgi:hypothetical protein
MRISPSLLPRSGCHLISLFIFIIIGVGIDGVVCGCPRSEKKQEEYQAHTASQRVQSLRDMMTG